MRDHYQQHSDVPTTHFGSWYDSYARATSDNFIALSALKRSPHRLIMGPWLHGVRADEEWAGDVYLGPDAIDSYDSLRLRWFDQWIKQLDTGTMDESAVRIFAMGTGSGRKIYDVLGRRAALIMADIGVLSANGPWRGLAIHPFICLLAANFQPRSRKCDSLQPPIGSTRATRCPLSAAISRSDSTSCPAVDQRGGASLSAAIKALDPLPLAARSDVVVFQSEPLQRDLEVTGPITVSLWVSSSAPDTDFTVKLIDVYPTSADYPDGYALNLTDSIMRVRFPRLVHQTGADGAK